MWYNRAWNNSKKEIMSKKKKSREESREERIKFSHLRFRFWNKSSLKIYQQVLGLDQV